jgi:hypothetical protein
VIAAGERHEVCSRDADSYLPPELEGHTPILAHMHNERWSLHL